AGQEDGRVDVQEEPLDRLDRVDVHVVRRLVEQQDVLLLRVREGARGEDLGLLAAGEGPEPLVEELLADAQVVQDRVVHDHALAAGGTPGDVEGFVAGHARARVRGVPGVRAGHPRLEDGELRLDPLRLRARGREDVPDDGLWRDVRDLRKVAVPEPGLEGEVPQVRRRLAREESEQGALPRAVRADEGDLVPRLEEEVRVLEDERGAPGFPEVPARDDRLHVRGANPWSPMRLRPVASIPWARCATIHILMAALPESDSTGDGIAGMAAPFFHFQVRTVPISDPLEKAMLRHYFSDLKGLF